ncbi:IS5 family transposase [Nonomuraea antri]|uniref:IS5 family transposase n=1 Tax=Nonomuraea antri TaxID=2730852 RepID=UPI0038B3C1CC
MGDHREVIRRHELSDEEWERLRPFLPAARLGRPREDDRRVLNGIVWKIRTGVAWRDVPPRYGSWQSLYTRFRRWALDGTFTAMLQAVQAQADARGDIDWLVAVDSTIVRAHQHAAGARKGGTTGAEPDHALGRSRGGLTSKIHLACDGAGRPLAFCLSGGNVNDCTRLEQVLAAIRVPRVGVGRPRVRPDHLVADKGYSTGKIRAYLRRRGIACTIPERSDLIAARKRRGSRGGRPPRFDRTLYKRRNVVERCFNRLKQFRGLATRYDKTASSYTAVVTIACILQWL